MELNVLFKAVLEQDIAPVVVCDMTNTIVYMNPTAVKRYSKYGGAALLGSNLMDCHKPETGEIIRKVIGWFAQNTEHNRIFTNYSEKDNCDVYMIALRDENDVLVGYYEKHECRSRETAVPYNGMFGAKEE